MFTLLILDKLASGFKFLVISIAAIFYNIIDVIGDCFSDFAFMKIMSSDLLTEIYRRVGLLLALYMLLKLTISGIQMIVNPDLITDKERGVKKILIRVFIAIVLLGFIPFIFDKAFELQKNVLEQDIISKIVLGEDVSSNNFGRELASTLFVAGIDDKSTASSLKEDLKTGFEAYSDQSEQFESIGDAFLCLIIGIFACWMLLTYTIQLVIRLIQLCFLEIIAPVPIMASISTKKETALSSWVKQCLATYIDVFIRLFIIYLLILVERLIMSGSILNLDDTAYEPNKIISVLIILGTLAFIKKFPDLLKEMFPGLKTKAAGDLGFGSKTGAGLFARKGVNAVTGGLTGAAIGFIGGKGVRGKLAGVTGGLLNGTTKSALSNDGMLKNFKTNAQMQAKRNALNTGILLNGGSIIGSKIASMQKDVGLNTRFDKYKSLSDYANRIVKSKDDIEGFADKQSAVKRLKENYEYIQQAGRLAGESDATFNARISAAKQAWKDKQHEFISAVMQADDNATSIMFNGGTIDFTTDAKSLAAFQNIKSTTNRMGSLRKELINSGQSEFQNIPDFLARTADYDTFDNATIQARAANNQFINSADYIKAEANNSKK